jgi:rRNA 2'-O-methyltransferase fibrillarin
MSSVSGRHFIQVDLLRNVTPAIVEDARLPNKYRMLISTVDVIFADVAQPDQARIVIHNAQYFLKDGGHVVISIKASCVDSTIAPSAVFTQEVQTLRAGKLKPIAQITLEPYERDHAMVTGEHSVLSGMRMTINSLCSSVSSPPVGLSWLFCCKNVVVHT